MISSLAMQLKDPAIKIRCILNGYGAPVIDLIARLWIARVFFNAGLTKISDWENTLFLFEFEYAVPILPHELVAFMATCFELGMPVLLTIGLFTRLASLPLLSMALVIQFVLGASSPAYDNVEHFYWMILLLMFILKGPGKLSVDHLICKKFCNK